MMLNAPAMGILINQGGASYDSNNHERGTSPVGKLGNLFLKSISSSSSTANDANLIRETALRMLELCVLNGATPLLEERTIFNEIKRVSEKATVRLSNVLQKVGRRGEKQMSYMKSRTKNGSNDDEPLMFWSDRNICYGTNCLNNGPTEEELRHCKSCGLQYCESCVIGGSGNSRKWNKYYGVLTMTGELFRGCLCQHCSLF